MTEAIRISAVSYLNSIPFLYGIEEGDLIHYPIELSKDIPSQCADKLINGDVELGLVPVAVISQIPNAKIISDYCIGADGPVHSVLLISEVPLNEIDTILLDYQSRTSVQLCKILAEHYWKIKVKFEPTKENYETTIGGNIAAVVIGDRTFQGFDQFSYQYDLSAEWKKWKNLPFVFAAWVSNRELPKEFLIQFNQALDFGLQHKEAAINHYNWPNPSKEEQLTYLNQSIAYQLDQRKLEALKEFLKYIAI